jgi:hypothetical protein
MSMPRSGDPTRSKAAQAVHRFDSAGETAGSADPPRENAHAPARALRGTSSFRAGSQRSRPSPLSFL